MSVDSCKKCAAFVDTDYDCDFYYVTPESGEIESRGFCLNCREGLAEAIDITEQFKQDIYDHATPEFLAALYKFKDHLSETVRVDDEPLVFMKGEK